MEDILNVNMHALNNASNKALSLIKNLYDLKYFDKTNYEKNIKDLKTVFVDDNIDNNNFISYSPDFNSILVNKPILSMGIIDEDFMCVQLIHELIHMASTNRKKNLTGFSHEAVPITYNEGCTQYLALKLFYGDKLEDAIKNNPFYHDSVLTIKESIDTLGEEVIFNGFFNADLRKSVDSFSPKVLDKWIDYVMILDNSLEEKISKENNVSLEEGAKGLI